MTPNAQILAGLPGGYEWLIVLFVVLLLFGKRLPGVARSLGQGISSFKKGLSDPDDEAARKDADKHAADAPRSKARERVEESSEG